MMTDPKKNWKVLPDGTITWLGKPVAKVPDQAGNSFYDFIEALKEAETEEVFELQAEINRLEDELTSCEVECNDLEDAVEEWRLEAITLRRFLEEFEEEIDALLEKRMSKMVRKKLKELSERITGVIA